MPSLSTSIAVAREAVAAVLRIHVARPATVKKGKARPAKVGANLAGSAFCVLADRYLVTAHHILNGGKPRDPKDRFYAFTVPQNGGPAFHFPVTGFPLEDAAQDLAIIEIGPCATEGIHIPQLPIAFAAPQDGTRVLTVGFPAPQIASLNVDAQFNYLGGQFFLKSHANEGIVSAQYDLGGALFFELNVGWHHGESGGPIIRFDEELAAFSVMQHYRNITAPDGGLLPGPHRGRALSVVEPQLRALGAQVV